MMTFFTRWTPCSQGKPRKHASLLMANFTYVFEASTVRRGQSLENSFWQERREQYFGYSHLPHARKVQKFTMYWPAIELL